jgi:hypothetical protein
MLNLPWPGAAVALRSPKLPFSALLLISCASAIVIMPWLGLAGLLYWLYLPMLLAVGAFLFFRAEHLYLPFVLWIMFLSPWVRRVIDYKTYYHSESIIQITPYVVIALCSVTFFRYLRRMYTIKYIGFLLVFLGLMYGYFVGIVTVGPTSSTFGLLQWLSLVFLALHIASWRKRFWENARLIESTFLWTTLIIGTYGLVQYLLVLPWDKFWMQNTQLEAIGLPIPGLVRIFGTLNSPLPFATLMMAGLLVMVVRGRGVLRLLAACVGVSGLALSLTRTSWLGLVVGLLVLVAKLRRRYALVLLGGCLLLGTASFAFLSTGLVENKFYKRLETLTNLQEAGSYRARASTYGEYTISTLSNVWGNGVGSIGVATKLSSEFQVRKWLFDSGLLEVPYELGWPGTLLFVVGLGMVLVRPSARPLPADNDLRSLSTAIVVSLLAQLVSDNTFTGPDGLIFWTFVALRFGALTAQETRATSASCSASG